jgi:Protein of unknown function (DUF3073)
MAEWWSVEVFHGEFRASRWQQSYSASLIESAISHGAADWSWIERPHGVVFEVCFPDEDRWEAFRSLPAVRAALDAVPDPVNGLLIYRGRGGAAGGTKPRKPKPAPGAAALELEEPREKRRIVKAARKLLYNDGGTDLDRLRRELGTDPETGDPSEPDRGVPDQGEPVSRDIAAFDRSGD